MKDFERGLTLLELLVTLVIGAMALGLLMQMLDQSRRLEVRMSSVVVPAASEAWRMSLLRDAVRGVIASGTGEEHAFRGGRTSFSAQSVLAPGLGGSTAAPIAVQLELTPNGQRLRLELPGEAGKGLVIIDWPDRDGQLVYVADDGTEHTQWPPQPPVDYAALPRAVLIRKGEADEARQVVLSLVASPLPPTTRKMLDQM